MALPESADGIVIFTNALIWQSLRAKESGENPMRDITAHYGMLCQSLGNLKAGAVKGRGTAGAETSAGAGAGVCLRTLSVIFEKSSRFFGNDNFRTLPFYLYQRDRLLPQRGRRGDRADTTAALLYVITLIETTGPTC